MQRLRWHSKRPVCIACFYFLLRNFHFEYLMMRTEENSGRHHHITSLGEIVEFSFSSPPFSRFEMYQIRSRTQAFDFLFSFLCLSRKVEPHTPGAVCRRSNERKIIIYSICRRRIDELRGSTMQNSNVPERKCLTFEFTMNFYCQVSRYRYAQYVIQNVSQIFFSKKYRWRWNVGAKCVLLLFSSVLKRWWRHGSNVIYIMFLG